ncbi:MAG: hypothetical protein K2X93_09030 [Candidatus Obscuribacterales bacterium]|nr:hypothetical protein [Candidatus Obscuribacterales bacterium]
MHHHEFLFDLCCLELIMATEWTAVDDIVDSGFPPKSFNQLMNNDVTTKDYHQSPSILAHTIR